MARPGICTKVPGPALRFVLPLFIEMLHELDTLIQNHGDHAQDDDGGYHHVELEDLRAINNQISKPSSCGKKLADDNAHKGKADIDLHVAQNGRDGSRKHHLCEGGKTASPKGIDEL